MCKLKVLYKVVVCLHETIIDLSIKRHASTINIGKRLKSFQYYSHIKWVQTYNAVMPSLLWQWLIAMYIHSYTGLAICDCLCKN